MARINRNTIPQGSSATPRGGSATVPSLSRNDKNATYSEALDHAAGDDPFAQLLASLGFEQDQGLSGSQRDDLNKQLLDTIIQYYLTQENRDYNEQLLKDQRLYDSPMSQLLRLMSTGMSRDAALQALSGGSGSGSGSVPYSDPSQLGVGIAASQSQLNSAQAKTQIANTVFNGVNCLAGLVSLGFSIPQSVQQTKLLENQAYLTDKQKKAYDASSAAHSLIISSGVENLSDVFGNVTNTIKTIKDLAEGGNSAATRFIDAGGLDALRDNSLYCGQFLSQMYKTERDASDYAKQIESQLALLTSQAELNKVNTDKMSSEIDLVNAQVEKISKEQAFIEGQTALLKWHEENIKADTDVKRKQSGLIEEQTQGLDLANRVESTFLTANFNGQTGLSLLTDSRANDLLKKLRVLQIERDNGAWEKAVKTYVAEQEYLMTNYQLMYLYDSGQLKYMQDSPESMNNWLYYCRAAEECGLFDYIDTMVKYQTSGSWKVGPVGGTTKAAFALPQGTPIGPYNR